METRRRKREEANSSAPSSSSSGPTTRSRKRTRLSVTSSSVPTTATANTVVVSSTSTRSKASRTKNSLPSPSSTPMESTNEPSGSIHPRESSGQRGKNNGSNKDNSDKGKEKKHKVRARVRDRDTERSSGLNIDGGADDNDNDSDGDKGILHQDLTSASSALQGLLQKLGIGLDELLPSSAMGRKGGQMKILSGLRANGEEGRQVEALMQLCETLCIASEESLRTFLVESFIPVLVGLLNHESNPNIMFLTAKALTHLYDVHPSSCAAVVHYGAVQCFVARLLTIEYLDLAK